MPRVEVSLFLVLLGLHFAVAVVTATVGRHLGRGVFWLCAVVPAATMTWASLHAPVLLDGGVVTAALRWVPDLDLIIDFRIDAFTLVMIGLVAGIGTLIFAYAYYYFDTTRPDLGRFAGLLLGFGGAMLGLVTADNLLAIFVFWELTSITSFLLIGFQHTKGSTRAAALQALLVTSGGGLALLAGVIMIAHEAGTTSLSAIVADPPSGGLVAAGLLCIFAGIATKSAQAPFHGWLPGAMAAPTPVSAYLHSATMVKAGVYLTARLAPAFALTVPLWRPLVVTIGMVTMLIGGYRALRQHDLKLLLAFGTVSQLGFMMVLFGLGTEEAVFAGVALLLAHAAFKAALFMMVGVIDHATGTRDLRQLDGLARRLPAVAAAAALAAASMAGLPPLAGFIAKEAALTALAPGGGLDGALAMVWLVGVVIGSALTVAYSWRFWWGAFARKRVRAGAAHRDQPPEHAPAMGFWLPAGALAAAGLVTGIVPGLETALVEAGTVALSPDAHPHALALWHGFNPAVALTLVAVAVGAVLIARRASIEALQQRGPKVFAVTEAYAGTLAGVNRVADRVAAVTQSGSLPVYLAVILTAVIAAPTFALLLAPLPWRPEYLADSWLQVIALAVALACAIGVVRATRRFNAVLALGGLGYSTVTLFALHGAPDLALTQLLIETLGLIVFALALQYLPNQFHRVDWGLSRTVRWVVSVATGVFVTGFALVAGSARTAAPISGEFIARSVPEAHGANIVNVILVDFRGIDTLGEITVLAVAGLGIAALVLAPRRDNDVSSAAADEAQADAESTRPGGAG
jgi:multicomponent Na+:H+ antiporter subunit A